MTEQVPAGRDAWSNLPREATENLRGSGRLDLEHSVAQVRGGIAATTEPFPWLDPTRKKDARV